jgi:hypothetical protein
LDRLEMRAALKWLIAVHTLYDESLEMRILILPLLCLLVCPAGTLPAQQAVPGQVCVVFTVKDLSANPSTRDYENTITQAVSAAFGAGGYRVLEDSVWQDIAAARSLDPGSPVTETDALAIAAGVGADLAITGIYFVQDDDVYYSIQCWSVASGKLAAALQADTPFNLAFFSGLNIALSSDLLPRLPAAAESPESVVFVSPDEGMAVKLSGDQYIGRVANGRVTIPADSFVPGAKVLLEKTKPGFHPALQTVTLRAGRDIPLTPLVKEHRNAFELDSTLGQLLGLGAALRYYPVPDWSFVTLSGYLWAQPPANLALRAVVHADTSTTFGWYLFLNPDAPVRVGISTGAGVILSFLSTPGLPTFSDFYLDVFNWWLEARLFGTTFFVRQELKYALGFGINLIGQGWMMRGFPPTTFGVVFPW